MKRNNDIFLKAYFLNIILSFLFFVSVFSQTIIIDNEDAGFSTQGTWSAGSAQPDKYLTNYRYATVTYDPNTSPTATAKWTPDIPKAGYYYIYVWYPVSTNRSVDSPFTIAGDEDTTTIRMNQQYNGGFFYYIAQIHMKTGTNGYVMLGNNASKARITPSLVLADAVKFEYAGEIRGPGPIGSTSGSEYRGMWVSRFEWPQSTKDATLSLIDKIMQNLKRANFNAVFMQVRGSCETLYPSPYEPWGMQYSFTNPGYDPLEYGIEAAHNNGLEFHAYINTHVIYQANSSNSPPPHSIPEHPFWLHGNPADPNHSEWCYADINGKPQALGAGEERYVWAAPGVPSYTAWVRNQIVYLAEKYNVDGVHFDRIRSAGDGSHDKISVERFEGAGNPDSLLFQDWTRDQITRFCNDVYGAIAEINKNRNSGKRYIKVSSAPFYAPPGQLQVNQDVNAWTKIGAMDFFVPQVYGSQVEAFKYWMGENFKVNNGRLIVGGMNKDAAGSMGIIFSEVQACRDINTSGTLVFSYSKYNDAEWDSYASNVFGNIVSPPDMPWISKPADAIIIGNVKDRFGNPVVDAAITRNDTDYTWLSGGDGFYAMLKVPSDIPLTIKAEKTGFDNAIEELPPLSAGDIKRINIILMSSYSDLWLLY